MLSSLVVTYSISDVGLMVMALRLVTDGLGRVDEPLPIPSTFHDIDMDINITITITGNININIEPASLCLSQSDQQQTLALLQEIRSELGL